MVDTIELDIVVQKSVQSDVEVQKQLAAEAQLNNVAVPAIVNTYNYPQPTGDGTSSRIGDDAYIEENVFRTARIAGKRPALDIATYGAIEGWFYLVENNTFGNKQRFTDKLGGTDYQGNDNYYIDHYTGLGWSRRTSLSILGQQHQWNELIDAVYGMTEAGFSDWFVPSKNQLDSIMYWGSRYVFRMNDVSPYPAPLDTNSNSRYHTSTQGNNITSNILSGRRGGNYVSVSKTSTASLTYPCRKHF